MHGGKTHYKRCVALTIDTEQVWESTTEGADTGWSARERELHALNHVLKSDASPRVHMVQIAEHQDSWGSIQLRRLNEHDVSIAEVSIHPLATQHDSMCAT